VLDGVTRRDARRWGRGSHSLRRRAADRSGGVGEASACRDGSRAVATGTGLSRRHERWTRAGRSGSRAGSRRGRARRAVAHSTLFIGRFARELRASWSSAAARRRDGARAAASTGAEYPVSGVSGRGRSGRSGCTIEASRTPCGACAAAAARFATRPHRVRTPRLPMATSTRTVVPPSPPPRRRRGRTLAAALCGGLAGLVAGTALVALAPAVGRASAGEPAPASTSTGDSARGRPHRGHVAGVSAVLLPAIAAGARSSPVDEREGEGP